MEREDWIHIQRLAGKGRLVIGPRPGQRRKGRLFGMGLTHVCTLLREAEDPFPIKAIARDLGCQWVWLPVRGGSLDTLKALNVDVMVTVLARAIAGTDAPKVYLHCAAGIHRTGFFAALLLRLSGVEDVPQAVAALRGVTAEQIGPERMALAIGMAETLLRQR